MEFVLAVHRGKALVEVEIMVETLTARPRGHALLLLRRNGVMLTGGRRDAAREARSESITAHCVRRAVRDSLD